MKRLAILAITLMLGISTASASDEIEAGLWLWPSGYANLEDSTYTIRLEFWVQCPDSLVAGLQTVIEYDANFFDPIGGVRTCEGFGEPLIVEGLQFLPNCADMGAGDTQLVLIQFTCLGANCHGVSATTGKQLGYLEFAHLQPDSMRCHAEPFKIHCNMFENNQYVTEMLLGIHSVFYGEGLAIANACLKGDYGPQYGCYAEPECPGDPLGYSECRRCPPQLSPPEGPAVGIEPRAWGLLKGLYR